MIIGLGTDIVNIARIEKTLRRFGKHFLQRFFSESEQADITRLKEESRAAKTAKIFAAKEAAVKALGCGFRGGVSWKDVSVGHDAQGKPLLQLRGRAAGQLQEISGGREARLHLSLSDDYPVAAAVVIIDI